MSQYVVVALLLASVAMFIVLIYRVGDLRLSRMLRFTGDQGRNAIETMYHPLGAGATPPELKESLGLPITQTLLYHGHPQAIQGVDVAILVDLAQVSGGVIEIVAAVGDTVRDLTPLLRVFSAHQAMSEQALRKGVELGEERTFDQDPKYAVRLLVDIAIRALSPAVNDPTTAVQVLDQIGDLLFRLGRSRLDIGTFSDTQGQLRLVVPFPAWEDFLRLAFDEILFYGATSVLVMRRMNALVSDLISALPEERRAALRHWKERTQATIVRSFIDPEEKIEASKEDRQGLGISPPGPAGS